MTVLHLEGHYGQTTPIDLCRTCHLVWFDAFESARLSGLGWVRLLRQMQSLDVTSTTAVGPLHSQLSCVHCAQILRPVQDMTRFGRYASLECPQKHGFLQTYGLLLASRGLVRPMTQRDADFLRLEKRALTCLNCGAGLTSHENHEGQCSYCESPLLIMDMPRLMQALLMRRGEPVKSDAVERLEWRCRGCGANVHPTQDSACEHCGHTIVAPSLLDLKELLNEVEPILLQQQPRQAAPHGTRLREMQGDAAQTAFHRYAMMLLRPDRDDVFDQLPEGWDVVGRIAFAVVVLLFFFWIIAA